MEELKMKSKSKKTLFVVSCTALMCTFLLSNCGKNNNDEPAVGDVTLSAPANNATGVAVLPTFTWQAAANAKSYTLAVAGNESFTGATELANLTVTSATLTNALSNDTKYYWKVTATGEGAGNAKTSAVFSFTTEAAAVVNPPVGDVTLTAPADNATDVGILPTFTWQAAANAVNYTLVFADNENFTNAEELDGITGTSLTMTDELEYGTTYYWKVTAIGAGTDNAKTSSVFSFTTEEEEIDVEEPTLTINHASYLLDDGDALGTYTAPANASKVELYVSYNSGNYSDSPSDVTESGGSISITKAYWTEWAGPASNIYAKIVATVKGQEYTSNEVRIHKGASILQVHDFMSTADMTSSASATVDDGVWKITFQANENYNVYGIITLSNLLDGAGKSISDIKGVYFKYKVDAVVEQTVTYVRENTNAVTFNMNNVAASDEWTEHYELRSYTALDNSIANRRTSFGMRSGQSTPVSLYITDYYFVFD